MIIIFTKANTYRPGSNAYSTTLMREQAPLLTDQFEFVSRLIANEVPIPIYDIDDFDYAVEQEDFPDDTGMH